MRKQLIEKLVERAIKRLSSNQAQTDMRLEALQLIPKLVGDYGEGNCWGTTLWTIKAYEQPKFIGTDEMQLWLDRNTVPVERPCFGDILVIHANGSDFWVRNGVLSHTALRIGNGLYWHQAGSHGRYKVGSLKEVLAQYPGTYKFVRRKSEFEVVKDWQAYGEAYKKAA